jgi:hypothetical protein
MKENAPLASVTVLLDSSQERKTWTPARADPPDVIDPRNVMLGGGGSVGPPLHAVKHPKAAATASRKIIDFVFMVRLPFAMFLPVLR